jgi:hypothetical protein
MKAAQIKRKLACLILAAALCFGVTLPGAAAAPEIIAGITVNIPEAPGLTATFKNVYADYFAPANVTYAAQSDDVLNGQYLCYFGDTATVSFNQNVMLTYASSEGFNENNNPTLYAGQETPIGFKFHVVDGKVVQSLSEAQLINWSAKRGENAVEDYNLYIYYNSAAQSQDFSFDLRESTWGTPRMSLYNLAAAVTPQQQTYTEPAAPVPEPADGAFVVRDFDAAITLDTAPSAEHNGYEFNGFTYYEAYTVNIGTGLYVTNPYAGAISIRLWDAANFQPLQTAGFISEITGSIVFDTPGYYVVDLLGSDSEGLWGGYYLFEVTGGMPADTGTDTAPPTEPEENIAPLEEEITPPPIIEEPGFTDTGGWRTFARTDYTVAVSALVKETVETVSAVGSFGGPAEVPVYWLPFIGADIIFSRTDGQPLIPGESGGRYFVVHTLRENDIYSQDRTGIWEHSLVSGTGYGINMDYDYWTKAAVEWSQPTETDIQISWNSTWSVENEIYGISPDGRSYFFFGFTDEAQATPAEPVVPSVPLPPPSVSTVYGDSVLAAPTASTVYVNGIQSSFDAYNINDSNYFKLRDLAHVLSGTLKQFDVGWNINTSAVTLTSGLPYTPVGGEMVARGLNSKVATPTDSKIYINGVQVNLTVYFIEGNNYFKLRDIGQALNFGVNWDAANNAVVIDTNLSYTP